MPCCRCCGLASVRTFALGADLFRARCLVFDFSDVLQLIADGATIGRVAEPRSFWLAVRACFLSLASCVRWYCFPFGACIAPCVTLADCGDRLSTYTLNRAMCFPEDSKRKSGARQCGFSLLCVTLFLACFGPFWPLVNLFITILLSAC